MGSRRYSKRARGERSEAAEQRRFQKYVDSGRQGIAREKVQSVRYIEILATYPAQLIHIKPDQARIRNRVRQINPLPPSQMRPNPIPASQPLRLDVPPSVAALTANDDVPLPSALLKRTGPIMSHDRHRRIVNAFHRFLETKPNYADKDDNRSRSATPACHIGIWETYSSFPYLTADTWNQSAETIKAMDEFLWLFHPVFRKLNAWLEADFPEVWERAVRCHQRVLRHLGPELTLRPALNFGPAFCATAVKTGTSEIVHVDCHDDPRFITWLIVAGNWIGGELVLPQLGQRFELRPRRAFGFLARTLAHCALPVTTGTRIIMTCFMERNLLLHADNELFKGNKTVTCIDF